MKKYVIFTLSILGIFFVFNGASADALALSQKEIADLAKPAVVKIVQKVKGEAKVPIIEINFTDLTVGLKPGTELQTVPVDEYLTGTGAIVHSDGYIMTNSHVVSYQTVKNLIAAEFIAAAIEDSYADMSEGEIEKIQNIRSSDELNSFGEKIVGFFLEKSQFKLEKTITVLNPSSRKENLEELIDEGFTAKMVSVNDDFYRDSRDAALIKIEETNLPALEPGSSKDISTGKKVFIFGFPSTAEVSEKDILEPTFTQGSISAVKDSMKRDFKIFQTDAKISKGSSGGPLLAENGKAVGLVTFITSDLTKEEGDSFAFAVPMDVVKEILRDHLLSGENIPEFQISGYEKHFRRGLDLLSGSQCREAIAEFSAAAEVNEKLSVNRYLEPYAKQCGGIIRAGNSIDGFWDRLKRSVGGISGLTWAILLTVITAVSALAFIWLWLFRRVREDEREMDNIEKSLNLDLQSGLPIKNEPGRERDNPSDEKEKADG
ncbi:MAG: trypsin-like peptidase domain-containing protein [Candidatus Moranbacteria bacterium]|nr:trypsin-like peptidase domain-containing protein [Candidatus Moranbacteria bacterium]